MKRSVAQRKLIKELKSGATLFETNAGYAMLENPRDMRTINHDMFDALKNEGVIKATHTETISGKTFYALA